MSFKAGSPQGFALFSSGLVAHQLVWTALIILAGRALLTRLLRKMDVHGG